jgi:glycosyltransferase involved in cell wall biosynthesis
VGPRVAYLINQYPKVSHTFIRREILALEKQGLKVLRIALRGWDAELTDAEDRREQEATRYVLRSGVPSLAASALAKLVSHPIRFLRALFLAIRMSRGGDRSLPYHLVYLAEACRVVGWLRDFGATHLHAHFGTNSAEIAMLAHELGGPEYSFTVHGPEEFDKPAALKLRDKVHRARFVVAISSFTRSQLFRAADPGDWRKIEVVRCGLDRAFYEGADAAIPDRPRIVCVGRICEQKGQLLLVEAAARLAARGKPFEIVLAGDGELRAAVEQQIERAHLGSCIRITGWIDSQRVRDEILSARALVLPSFAEGLPIVLTEAMALGRPVLTTYIAGIPELVQHKVHGWLFPAGDIDALMLALEECLAAPTALLSTMGEAGKAMVTRAHSIDAESARLAALFGGSALQSENSQQAALSGTVQC